MKIAIASDDAANVSQHFGRATHYVVLTIEDGRVAAREEREKVGHEGGHAEHGHAPPAGEAHRHGDMIGAVADCEVLVAGRMGAPAYEAIRSRGLRPILTDLRTVDDVARAFVGGTLADHPERVHM